MLTVIEHHMLKCFIDKNKLFISELLNNKKILYLYAKIKRIKKSWSYQHTY